MKLPERIRFVVSLFSLGKIVLVSLEMPNFFTINS